MSAVLLQPRQDWVCPNCPLTQTTFEAQPHTRFHACPGLMGLTAPMVRQGQRVAVTAEVREDYVGRDVVQTGTDGVPYQAVRTTREDGEDLAVLAPTASVRAVS